MHNSLSLRRVNGTRYLQPLREGGLLPALAESARDLQKILRLTRAIAESSLGQGTQGVASAYFCSLLLKNVGEMFQ